MNTEKAKPSRNQQGIWHMQGLAFSKHDIDASCTELDPKQFQLSNPTGYPHGHISLAQPEQRVSQSAASRQTLI